jgi:hypothetical protein
LLVQLSSVSNTSCGHSYNTTNPSIPLWSNIRMWICPSQECTHKWEARNNGTILLSAKKFTPGYLPLFSSINYLHTKLTKLTVFVCCLVTRNWTSATKSLGMLSTKSWWDMRKYTTLRAKATSKLASHSLRKIVGVNISTI